MYKLKIDKSGIGRYLFNVFNSGELDEEVVVVKIATITQHGAIVRTIQSLLKNYYNLDADYICWLSGRF